MKKYTLVIVVTAIIFIVLIIGGWIFVKATDILNTYRMTSTSNEPNLKVGQYIVTSNTKTPKRFDFIAYQHENITVLHRLCGLSGDTLQLIDGLLYVNHKLIKDFLTEHNYNISETELELLNSKGLKVDNYEVYMQEDGSRSISFDGATAEKYGIANKRFIEKQGVRDKYIGEQWKNDYNADNFGPVIVPEDCYFVLGDNRHYSADSRYIGFIHKSKYVATLLGNF